MYQKTRFCFCCYSKHTTTAVAIFGKGRLTLQVRMGSGFSMALRENNSTSPVLSRIEQNCFFSPLEKRLGSCKSSIKILFTLLNKFGHNIEFLGRLRSIQVKKAVPPPSNFLLGFAGITRSSKSDSRSAEIHVSAELSHPIIKGTAL